MKRKKLFLKEEAYLVKNLRPIGYYPNEFLNELKKLNLFLYDVINDGIVFYDDGFMKLSSKKGIKKWR